jgi:hypothetical protein
MTRRALFAALAAPLLARLLPKPKPIPGGLFNPKINVAKLYQEHWGSVMGAQRVHNYHVSRTVDEVALTPLPDFFAENYPRALTNEAKVANETAWPAEHIELG